MLLPLTLLVAAGLAIGGPAVLWVVGDEYFREAAPLMLVLAVQSVVETVVVVFYMVSQIVRRLRLMVLMQIIVMVITVGGSYLLLPRVGLIGVGIASLTAVTVGAAIAIRPLLHALAQLLRNAQNGNADTDGKAHSDVYPPTVDGDFYIPDTQVTDKIPVIRTGAHRVPPSELDTDRFPALP